VPEINQVRSNPFRYLSLANASDNKESMGAYCRHCRALLSRDEYFWFYDSCIHCEKCAQIRASERKIAIKSPLYAWVEIRFQLRRLRHRFTAYLKSLDRV